MLTWQCKSAMFRNFCVGIHRYGALTYDVIKSYITRGTRHNSADSVPTSNLFCITEVAIRTTLCIARII